MGIEIRVPVEEDWVAFCHVDGRAFGFTYSEQDRDDRRPTMDLTRFRIACDGPEIVGIAGTFSFDVTVPGGGVLPMAGLTWVSTAATHRRRGILTRLMGAVHRDVDERGEPLANLSASQAGIYERFGYGIATSTRVASISTRGLQIAEQHRGPQGAARFMSDGEARNAIPPIWDRYRRLRAGEVLRSGGWHDGNVTIRARPQGNASAAFYLGHADGYAVYRVVDTWNDGFAEHELQLTELVAATPAAHVALWSTLLDMDLVTTIKTRAVPEDDPLAYLVTDYRAVRTVALMDGIWVNVRNPKTCLEARTYATDDELVIALVDGDKPGRRLSLTGSAEGGSCRTVRTKPDLTMSTATLGGLLYGGVRPSRLAAARKLEARSDDILRRAELLFPMAPLPYCQTAY